MFTSPLKPLFSIALLGMLAITPAYGTESAPECSGGKLVLGMYQASRHLNGAIESGFVTSLPSTKIFASLLRFNDKWEPQPFLAESWEWSKDNLALTVHLRKNAVFHDGHPITSDDVAFSIMAIKKNHPFKTMFAAIDHVDTPDAHTAVFRLSNPHPALLFALSPALSPIIPKHIYDDGHDLKTHPRNTKDVVGSGPFRLKEFVAGKHVILERFDKYFIEGKPCLDELVIQINEDQLTLLMNLERGDIQLLPFIADPVLLRRSSTNNDLTLEDRGYEGIGAQSWIAFNTEKQPYNDKRVRKAIAHAIDKDFIIKTLAGGFAKPSSGPIVSTSQYFGNTQTYDVDLEKAELLLDEAGFTKSDAGVRFTTSINFQPGADMMHKNVAEYVRGQLKKIGIMVNIRASADFPSWSQTIANRDFEMTTDTVWNWGDPVIGVHRTYLSENIRPIVWTNTQNYRNEKVDELLEAASTEMDMEKRKALYAEFQAIVTDDVPIVYTAQMPYHTLSRKNVKNVPIDIWGPLSPMDDLTLSK